jgi:hypothetical protein
VSRALEAREASHQQLATPHGGVASVAAAIVDHAHGRALLAVLAEHGGEMGVVMLHPQELHPGTLQGVSGGEVVGVQIVHEHLGADGEQRFEVLRSPAEGAQGLPVAQIADVV